MTTFSLSGTISWSAPRTRAATRAEAMAELPPATAARRVAPVRAAGVAPVVRPATAMPASTADKVMPRAASRTRRCWRARARVPETALDPQPRASAASAWLLPSRGAGGRKPRAAAAAASALPRQVLPATPAMPPSDGGAACETASVCASRARRRPASRFALMAIRKAVPWSQLGSDSPLRIVAARSARTRRKWPGRRPRHPAPGPGRDDRHPTPGRHAVA